MSSYHASLAELPGITVPLNYFPVKKTVHGQDTPRFPNALDYGDIQYGSIGCINTQREILMMRLMNTITDKPEWNRKVFDETITSKWREEVSQGGDDVTPKMMDWIIKELQWKAGIFQETGQVSVFDVGVVKSDTAIPEQLQQALKHAVIPFENIRDEKKDYHPGFDQKVVDLVHPSLFPVIFGRTRVLYDKIIGLDDCLGSLGLGDPLPVPEKKDIHLAGIGFNAEVPPFSRKFQWLPCDVEFTDHDPGCRLVSYINNAHPVDHRELYVVVEKVIARAIPLWNKTLFGRFSRKPRIEYFDVEYLDPELEPTPREEEGETYDSDAFWDRHEDWLRSRQIKLPEPGEFEIPEDHPLDALDLRELFCERGLQVIVKLANIELTPEKPDYHGGSWHIEGQLNERICATSIYYYDNENITQSSLAFRQRATEDFSDISYEQNQHEFLQQVFGFGPEIGGFDDTQITQDLGSVVCREGRLLTFPNILQHQVSPFSLVDRAKPGHRKILALFLIDPDRRIISSANVPPQQANWGHEKRKLVNYLLSQRLPVELRDMIEENIESSFITMDEAKAYRLELMQERSVRTEEHNQWFESGSFSLCEH